jgi:glutathione S-transferase
MKMILYQYPGGDGLTSVSPPCQRVELALGRLGADYEVVYLKSWSEARKVSATGRLPLLEMDGRRIHDSIEILDELERRIADPALSPADPDAKIRDKLWEHFFNDHVYFLGYHQRWVCPENRERWLAAMLKRAPWFVRTVGPILMRRHTSHRARAFGIAGKSSAEVARAYDRAMEMVVAGLAGGPFLQSHDQPYRGDLAVAATVAQIGFRDTLPDTARRALEHPPLMKHTRRVFEACSLKVPRWIGENSSADAG